MIIKSHIRGGYRSAAEYLKEQGQNEETRLVEISDPKAKNLDDAFHRMWITNKRRAIIPIPRKLMTFLRIAKSRGSENFADEYVINYFGKPVLRLDQSFRRVSRDAGFNDVTPHTLRHTAATWMAQAGVPLWVIAKYLGHSSTRTTERVYAHHNPSFLLEAKEALERSDAQKPGTSARTTTATLNNKFTI